MDAILASTLDRTRSLFVGPRYVLSDTWSPSRLVHREEEVRQLTRILSHACRGDRPANVLVYGLPGTGKTVVVTAVVDGVKRKAASSAPVTTVLVNCRDSNTTYGVLRTVVNSLRSEADKPLGQKLGTDVVIEEYRRLCKRLNGPLIVVLDEVDQLVKESGDAAIYSLLRPNEQRPDAGASVVGVSNDLQFEQLLGARVRSRLNEQKVLFHRYTQPQLTDILLDRAKLALSPSAYSEDVVQLCALYAAQNDGDARRAISLLRTAVQLAEKEGAGAVTPDHAKRSRFEVELDLIGATVKGLPLQVKVLLWAILALTRHAERGRGKGDFSSGEVYEAYRHVCDRLGHEPATTRSVSNHLAELETLGIIQSYIINRGRGGRTRDIRCAVPTYDTMRALAESEPHLFKVPHPGEAFTKGAPV